MAHKLVLNNTRLPNRFHPGKPRELDRLPKELRKQIEELCDGKRRWPLLLHGTVGTGKSCAALCLVDRVRNAEFFAMPEFVAHVKSVREGRAEWYHCGHGGVWTEREWWRYVTNLPLLVLDDVGLRNVKYADIEMDVMFLALEARDGLPLVCTSNINEDEILTTYNDRIHSRMCSGTVYPLGGRDQRFPQDGF